MSTRANDNNIVQFWNVNMLPSMVVSRHETVNIISRTVANLVWNKSALSTGNFIKNTTSRALSALPVDGVSQLWQLPAWYPSQLHRVAMSMLESVATLSRAQQQHGALQIATEHSAPSNAVA